MLITENMQSQPDQNKFCLGVFVDLKKAFVHKWVCSYLTKRKQYVTVGNQVSALNEISTGVPQGPVLWPLHKFICINNLHKSMKYSKTYHTILQMILP